MTYSNPSLHTVCTVPLTPRNHLLGRADAFQVENKVAGVAANQVTNLLAGFTAIIVVDTDVNMSAIVRV